MDPKKLRIVFMGTPDFAVACLRALVENGYSVVAVVTVPDKPAGRGQQITYSAVKQYAMQEGLAVLQPEKLKDESFLSELSLLKPDLNIVVAFRMLPEVVWNMPRLGTFNLHASLLPRYRGAAPINWALINGDTESGVTTFKIEHQIDTGYVIFQEKVEIAPTDNAEVLHDKLMRIGAPLVLKTVDALASGNIEMISQEALISKGIMPTPAPKIFKDDCQINWNESPDRIKNLIRGLSPYPAAWTNWANAATGQSLSLKIFNVEAEFIDHDLKLGSIKSDGKTFLKIACKNGFINVLELQLAGKKRMPIGDFLRGFSALGDYRCVSPCE